MRVPGFYIQLARGAIRPSTPPSVIGVARVGPTVPWPPKFLEHIVILCFERRYPKQNSVIRLKSNILARLPKSFYATAVSYATECETVSVTNAPE